MTKLYTEEQLRNTAQAMVKYTLDAIEKPNAEPTSVVFEKHFKSLQPVELPSIEEVQKEAYKYVYENKIPDTHTVSFIDGVRMIMNKINEI